MVQVRRFIRTPKTVVSPGQWRCGALNPKHKMGPKAFDFGSRKPFQLGNQWWWRVDDIECEGTAGRLLIAYHLQKENYVAWLAINRGGDHVIVACLEYHATHPGWHFHTRCGVVADLAPNVQRQRNEGIRIPGKGRYHRPEPYEMSDQEAVNRAYKAFRIGKRKEGDLL